MPFLRNFRPLLDGKWLAGQGERFAVRNPATGQQIAELNGVSHQQTLDAIQRSSELFQSDTWSQLPAIQRADILNRLHSLMLQHQADLAELITAENGKPINESRAEVKYAASYVRWFAEECRRVDGHVLQHPVAGRRLLVLKQPVGVVSIITPWNFPLAMIARKVAPALAAGCTALIKPATETPLSALALCQLAMDAGVPGGALQCLPTSRNETASLLTTNPLIRKVSFTGSTQTGKLLAAAATGTMKRISMELGGQAPFIVFPDFGNQTREDFLGRAVQSAVQAKFRNCGQACVAANVFYVHRSLSRDFVQLMRHRISQLRIGDPRLAETDLGPMISQSAKQKVQAHLDDAQARGAQIIPCQPLQSAGDDDDHQAVVVGDLFQRPYLLDNCTMDMLVGKEETFGPLVPIIEFDTEQDVVRMANQSQVGLAAYFFSRDIGRIWRVAEQLQVGMVGVNEGLISSEVAPFGGIKESGCGREGSRYGMDDYLNLKYICIGGILDE